ncbi:MAG: SDR family NAD(P)-dependent oxidoreductase [Pseudohongiellaceae bacterium]
MITDEVDAIESAAIIVIGASSVIAQALLERFSQQEHAPQLVTISRQSELKKPPKDYNIRHYQSDYSEGSIGDICQQLKPLKGKIRQVYICNGILHKGSIKPEKRVEDILPASLHQVFESNAIVPMLWLKKLKPLLTGKQQCVVTVFSARIGSIEDNNRGGWYAYRASKAALNMFVKTAAIEYKRSARALQFLVFHPGTTDTPLSKPFHKFVSEDRLFTPEFVAEQLLKIVDSMTKQPPESTIQFLDWQGKKIPW